MVSLDLLIDYYFPKDKNFTCEHFYMFCNGFKSLLKISEATRIFVPNYICVPLLQKTELFEYCKSNEVLNKYLPNCATKDTIQREFLLQVRFYIFQKIKIIRAKDPNKFNQIEKIIRQYEEFKRVGKHNDYSIKVNSEIAEKLKNYVPVFSKQHFKIYR